jgi:mannose-6-phosphate isomerase-like protein (cupin superfamily)
MSARCVFAHASATSSTGMEGFMSQEVSSPLRKAITSTDFRSGSMSARITPAAWPARTLSAYCSRTMSYDETWVVVGGNLTFQAGDEQVSAGPGDIVVVPPELPHKFTNDGPGPANLVCVHANPTFITEWLE